MHINNTTLHSAKYYLTTYDVMNAVKLLWDLSSQHHLVIGIGLGILKYNTTQ